MSRNSKALLGFFALDIRLSVLIFCSIFLASMIPLVAISSSTSGQVVISSSMAVAIFCAISGFVITKETFPFSIRMGSTRHEYVLSVLIFSVLLASFMSGLNLGFLLFSEWFANLAGLDNISLLVLSDLLTSHVSWYTQFGFDFMLFLLVFILGFFLSAVFHRFGMIGGLITIAFVFIAMFVTTIRTVVIDLLIVTERTADSLDVSINNLGILGITIVLAALIWIILKNASITPGVMR
ncbi:hypothetical protein [Paenisporosarcina sp. TG20]|uniref:hypothetical protein n=1 Tax=Paenisporosarcina sp. TG20 TaxID=1211706 RepID=UPI000300784B|nr:hypothetical protein [Paenisporosarcina sp. TG20]